MVVYNVSIKVLNAYCVDWVTWMQDEHIPAVMSHGCFTSYQFYRLLDQDESEGQTYVVQYYANTMEEYIRYRDLYAKPLQSETALLFKDKFVAFRTLMQSL